MSVRQADGVTWVADTTGGFVAKMSDGGSILKKITTPFSRPVSVSVNENDGCCWVVDQGKNRVCRLDADGNVVVDKGGFDTPYAASCYCKDGSCWVADMGKGRVVKLGANGNMKFECVGGVPIAVAVDQRNGNCWAACTSMVVKYSPSGAVKKQITGLTGAFDVCVNQSNGSIVVAEMTRVTKYDANGNKKWTKGGFSYSYDVAINKDDGSVWVADMMGKKVVKLSSSGQQLLEIAPGFNAPMGVDIHY